MVMVSNALSRLSELLTREGLKPVDLAKHLGINSSAISQWNKIPHNRVTQMIDLLKLTTDDIDILLGNQPLGFHYRTTNRKELYKHTVAEDVKQRTEFIYDIFVRDYMKDSDCNFDELRKKISSLNIAEKESSFRAADLIREEFNIPGLRPISRDFVEKYILEDLGIHSYYMPFKSVGLHLESLKGDLQSAILFSKGKKYGILIDSDRNYASGFFDLLHEVVHIIIGDIFERGNQLESFIDKTVGELVYPKAHLQKLFVSPSSISGRIGKTAQQIIDILIEKYENDRTWCPSGLAKALIDYEMLGEDTDIYRTLTGDFYDFYKEKVTTMSELGEIDIDYSNFEAHKKLFENVIEKNPLQYPVYTGLRERLVEEEISANDYAELFGMKVSEAKMLKSIWAEANLNVGELRQWKLK